MRKRVTKSKGQARTRPYLPRRAKGNDETTTQPPREPTPPPASPEPQPKICYLCYEFITPKSKTPESLAAALCPCFQHTCYGCMCQQVSLYMEEATSTHYECDCGRPLNQSHVVDIIGLDKFKKHLDRLTMQQLERDPYFMWCANEKCTSGQYYGAEVDRDPKVCCNECHSVNCFECRCPYHQGLGCEDFKKQGRKHTKTQSAMRTNNARHCPACNTAVELLYGCSHVRCEHVPHA